MFIRGVGFSVCNSNIEGQSGRLRMFIRGVGFRVGNIKRSASTDGKAGQMLLYYESQVSTD